MLLLFLAMKSLYHICQTAHSEVLLRTISDVRLFTNLTALSALRNNVDLLCDSFMSTHFHLIVACEDPGKFILSQSISLTKAFNYRHGRVGPLFDPKPFVLRLAGPRHVQMAMNYVLRQGLHHGISETPFEYRWSTCNHLFVKERGAVVEAPFHHTKAEMKKLLCRNAVFPTSWVTDNDGILLRSSFEQLAMVENWYGVARGFVFDMLRKSSEEWLADQENDNEKGPLITLDLLEKGYSSEEVRKMLQNEGNSKYVGKQLSDMEVCSLIDKRLSRFKVSSVYDLSPVQRQRLADELSHEVSNCSDKQLSRCLVMKYRIGR